MTHIPGKRPTRSRPGVVVAAVTALTATLALGLTGQARAAAAEVPPAVSPGSARPHGFASPAGGTTGGAGGAGGAVVTVTDQASLARCAAAPEPYVIRVAGSLAVEPFGSDVVGASDKTVAGVGDTGEIVHGGLPLDPGPHDVVIRDLTIRDSSVDGDRDGKTQDCDAIQKDTADQHPYQADAGAELVRRAGHPLRPP